jgi:acyl carrier protein
MEPSDIDVEIPFVDMGLDSVISVEWVQSLNKRYASNLATSCIYDYPTIRQLAHYLEKEGLRHPQTPIPLMSTLSLDDVLQQVHQRNLDPDKAQEFLPQMFL